MRVWKWNMRLTIFSTILFRIVGPFKWFEDMYLLVVCNVLFVFTWIFCRCVSRFIKHTTNGTHAELWIIDGRRNSCYHRLILRSFFNATPPCWWRKSADILPPLGEVFDSSEPGSRDNFIFRWHGTKWCKLTNFLIVRQPVSMLPLSRWWISGHVKCKSWKQGRKTWPVVGVTSWMKQYQKRVWIFPWFAVKPAVCLPVPKCFFKLVIDVVIMHSLLTSVLHRFHCTLFL